MFLTNQKQRERLERVNPFCMVLLHIHSFEYTHCLGDRVDKYGRPISDTHEQDNLKRFYRLEHEDNEIYAGEPKAAPDYARGDVLLESSDEDEDDKAVEDDESDPGDVVTIGRDHSRPIAVTADDAAEIDLNENIFADLDSQAAAYDKSHSKTPQEEGTRTRRLAVVNIDWDHVRATHLFRIFSSVVLPTAPALVSSSSSAPVHSDRQRSIKGVSSNVVRGKVLGVRVYPSEFGKERLQREEKEGPPIEVFKKRKDTKDEEVNEQNIYEVGEEDDYDEDALRKYQLERLRWVFISSVTRVLIHGVLDIIMRSSPVILQTRLRIFTRSWKGRNSSVQRTCST